MSAKNLELILILMLVIGSSIALKIKVPDEATAVVKKGRCIHLKCSLKMKKPHTSHNFVWYCNGEELQNITTTKYEVKKNNSLLIIAKADYDDSGNYSCGVRGDARRRHNDVTKIIVGSKPNATLQCKSSNMQEIYCFWNETFTNLPSKPIFSWKVSFSKKFTTCVNRSDGTEKNEECICETDYSCHFPRNHGTSYTMMVELTNDLGKKTVKLDFNLDSERRKYFLIAIPDKPRLVYATMSSSTATIKLSPPSDWKKGLYPRLYKIAYQKSDEISTWNEEVLPDEDQTRKELAIEGLIPFTKYHFKVACTFSFIGKKVTIGNKSEMKWSEWSETVDATTAEAAPGGVVKITDISQSGFDEYENRVYKVKWEPMSENEANGIILGYKIHQRQINPTHQENNLNPTKDTTIIVETPVKTYHVSNNITSYTVKGLRPDQRYSLDIVAYNSIADSRPAYVNIPAVPETTNKLDAVAAILIPVGATILILFGFMGRRLYRKVRGTGFFDPVARVQLPGDSEENNSAVLTRERQVKVESEVYDDLVITHLGEPIPAQANSNTQPKSLSADRSCVYNITDRNSGSRTSYIHSERRDADNISERTEIIPDLIDDDDDDDDINISNFLGDMDQEFMSTFMQDSTDKNNNDDDKIQLSCLLSEPEQSECATINNDSNYQDSERKQNIHNQFQYDLEQISQDEIMPLLSQAPGETACVLADEDVDFQTSKHKQDDSQTVAV
ncbi:neural cell adhesion molecule L1-like [Ptychodera flava]|uniref:neural cell adhesion molecule L1-like n=1 Tax=Ptychodera flava TaxID=63121 RepID=UPI00396A3635